MKNQAYNIKCLTCPKIYIGQTGCLLKTRDKQHHVYPECDKLTSNFAKNLFTNHDMNGINQDLKSFTVVIKAINLIQLENMKYTKPLIKRHKYQHL